MNYLLREVDGILRTQGDGPVPGHQFIENDQYLEGHWIHLRISGAVTQSVLTWQIVQDVLNGILDQYKIQRRSCKADAAVISRAQLIGFVFISIDNRPSA